MTSIYKTQNYIKGIIFDMIIDNLIDEQIIENGFNWQISKETHEKILNIANELINKIEEIGSIKFARRLIKEYEILQDDDIKKEESNWQDL